MRGAGQRDLQAREQVGARVINVATIRLTASSPSCVSYCELVRSREGQFGQGPGLTDRVGGGALAGADEDTGGAKPRAALFSFFSSLECNSIG